MISTDALHVLAGVLSLDLRAEMDRGFMALIRFQKSVDGTGLVLKSADLWKPTPKSDDLWRIPCTSDLTPKTMCTYYMAISKQKSNSIDSAFLAVAQVQS